ncbi:MAG: RNA-binding protein [Dehalococcoidia bacterium]|nr:RNA-binding protein [Dehalococcoidia bacterium]
MNIFCGNLAPDVSDDDLRGAFSPFGQVASASVIKDRLSGRSRGFGFVEMANNAEAQAAIDGLNGKGLKGNPVTVNQAKPREDSGGRGRGGPR